MNCSYSYPNSLMTRKGFIRVTGTGAVKAVPDTAIVSLGIVTENAILENARRENAVRTNTVVNALASMGIEKKDISTGAFSIDPIYDYIDGRQTFKGYRISNILTVTIEDIAKAGEIIDKATFAGANRIDNVSFTLSDITRYYDEALKLAVLNALHKAVEIGSTLDVQVDEIPFKIVEKSDGAQLFTASAAKLAAPSTPMMPGQLEITSAIVAVIGYK
ncbi:MAG TPA: SIMPL domain-containing protein [Clostridia bacterium]|nr:SIMPL domain-containing protein [Clostridia bacterium]